MSVMETKKELIESTIQQLMQVAKKFSRIEALPIPVEEGIQVTTAEAHTIEAIGEGEDIRVLDVATHFGITKSAASQMVTKLIQKGFVDKRQSPHSNKEFFIFLTELGWRAFHAHAQFHGKDKADLVDRLSPFSLSQIATLSVLLESLGSVMDQRLSDMDRL